jgi:hypothetical protein
MATKRVKKQAAQAVDTKGKDFLTWTRGHRTLRATVVWNPTRTRQEAQCSSYGSQGRGTAPCVACGPTVQSDNRNLNTPSM